MNYETIADIYSANQQIRDRFQSVVEGISETDATVLPDGETWSIKQLVEHVSIVEFSVMRICTKLVMASKEAGKLSDGSFSFSPGFGAKFAAIENQKFEAPDRVKPTGEVSLAEAVENMKKTAPAIAALRDDLQRYDVSGQTFPHPVFGDLTASEWLVVLGSHESRHTAQIEKILARIRR